MLRIIAGQYRGRKLITPDKTRPSMSKLRNALFNIIYSKIDTDESYSIADVFCGSGSIAAEALSRGATKAILIDNNLEAAGVAETNMKTINANNNSEVLVTDAFFKIPKRDKCDIIFIDPPYNKSSMLPHVLESLEISGICDKGTIVFIEVDKRVSLTKRDGFSIPLERHYGKAKLIEIVKE